MGASFAVHPNDNKRAKEMFFLAKNNGVSFQGILDEAESFLKEQHLTADFIEHQLTRIKELHKSIKFSRKKKSVWLIYWEPYERPLSNDNLIARFDTRRSVNFVSDFILQYYMSKNTSLEEKIYYASLSKNFPYQVQFENIQKAPWVGMMTCGHNPFITARIVKNLTLSIDDDYEMLYCENMRCQ